MELRSVSTALWRRFRMLAPVAQLAIAVGVALVLVAPFTAEPDQQTVVASSAVTTTTTAALVTTTAVPPTTATASLPAGLPAQGDDSSVVRVIDGDTVEVTGGRRSGSSVSTRPRPSTPAGRWSASARRPPGTPTS